MAKTTDAAANGQPTLASLKEEGSRAFAMKKYEEATAAWDRALSLGSLAPADAALLHNNKAACHMVGKRYKEAIAACSAALDVSPDYAKALLRRAKAYEAQGQHKQALADLQRANKLEGATEESRAAERRVRELAAGRKAPGAVGAPAGMGRQMAVPVKLTCGDDTRMFQVSPAVTYSELLDHAKRLFPAAGPFALKFVDREGDLVTIGSRGDINRAMQEAVESADRKRLAAGGALPPIRMVAARVASADEVPKAPEEEQAAMQKMLQQLQRMQAAAKAGGGAGAPAAAAPQPQPAVMVDEWILSMVELLKEHLGIDTDRPVEAQEVASERLHAGFQAMMAGDARADALLDEAEAKFAESAALAMSSQAQVWEARAQGLMNKAAGGAACDAAAVEALLAKAEAKAREAVAYCPACLDPYQLLSNIEQDRAKLAVRYLVAPVAPREDVADAAERQAAEEAAGKAAVLKAFAGVNKEGLPAADGHFDKAYAHLEAAVAALPAADREKELPPMKPMAEQVPGEDITPPRATLIITQGNARYEHSILRAAAGGDWRPLVQQAQALFREAGAAEVDIYHALKGHPKAEEMDDIIGPEPAKPGAPPPTPAPEEAPKGLPALGPRKKKDGQ